MVSEIVLLKGLGVEGDAHCGQTVKHRSRAAKFPDLPNLRQVHLIHSELFEEVAEHGFKVHPGEMGENITTVGLDLLALPKGTVLRIRDEVVLEIPGLRNPCSQIDKFQKGLMQATLGKDENGELIRKAGVMSIVLAGGIVSPGDLIVVQLPPEPHEKLQTV
jgi:MOSC domain-containing protein YiiM